METINTFDSGFSLNPENRYHLALQLNSKSITYAILDIDQRNYLGINQLTAESSDVFDLTKSLVSFFDGDAFLNNQFESVSVLTSSFRAMLVPESLFDSKNLKSFLKFHHDVDEKDIIQFVPLKPAESFVIFSMATKVKDLIISKLPNAQFAHHCVPFIYNALAYRDFNEAAPCLHIHFSSDYFDVLIVRNSKVQLFNSFYYKKYTDAIYFLVNLLNLFSLKPDHSKVYISGEVDLNSELKTELEKIFKPISFEQYNLNYKYTPELAALPQHKFVNLLNLHACEL